MIIQKEIRNLINELADKYNVTFEVAKEVIYSQFKFVRRELEKGDKNNHDNYRNVFLKYFGTFHVSKPKLEYFEKIRKNEEHN